MWVYKDYTELYHHGILGMKWGVRRGPPYPLGASNRSSSKKKPREKNTAKSVASKVITNYGNLSLAKGGKVNALANAGKKYTSSSNPTPSHQTTISNKAKLISQKTGLKLKTRTNSLQEDCKATAPKYSPNNPLARNNCGHCSMGYAMRRMGFDVEGRVGRRYLYRFPP